MGGDASGVGRNPGGRPQGTGASGSATDPTAAPSRPTGASTLPNPPPRATNAGGVVIVEPSSGNAETDGVPARLFEGLPVAPAPSDNFSGADLTAPVDSTGLFTPAVNANVPVASLVPDLSYVQTVQDLAQHFAADVNLVRGQLGLVADPSMKDLQRQAAAPAEGLQRLFSFFVPYADRFVTLGVMQSENGHTSSEQQGRDDPGALLKNLPLLPGDMLKSLGASSANDRAAAAQKIVEALSTLGLHQAVDSASGDNALLIARTLLQAPSANDVHARADEVTLEVAQVTVPQQLRVTHPLLPARAIEIAGTQPGLRNEEMIPDTFRARLGRLTNGRLGPRPLWNVLHTLRGTGEDSVRHQDELNKLALGAVLVLVAVFLLVVVLVML